MSTGLWECWAKNTDLWIETVCSEKTKTLQIRSLDIDFNFQVLRASLVAQLVKNLPAMQETWI